MRTTRAFLMAAATAGVLSISLAAFGGGSVKVGSKAPEFKASSADGSVKTLKEYVAKGPVTLYFIQIGCPVNHRAAPFFKKIDDAYKGKSNIVGVINGDSKAAKQWAKEYGVKFPLLQDPDLKIIHAYGAQHSPWAVTIGTDGKVTNVLEGGSADQLKVVNKVAAGAAKAKMASVSFDGAPSGGG